MSIVTKIESISNHLENAYNSLENIGVDLENVDKNINNLSAQIESVYNDLPKITDENTEITLTPTKKGKMELILKGNTNQFTTTGKNLFKNMQTSQIKNGITYTPNNDGTFNLTGTSTDVLEFSVYNPIDSSKLIIGNTYILSSNIGCGDNTFKIYLHSTKESSIWVKTQLALTSGTSQTGAISEATAAINYKYVIRVENGVSLNLKNIQIQLEEGSSVTNFEPYTGGIASPNPDYPQNIQIVSGNNQIIIEGKNKLPVTANSQTINGISFTVNSDKTITANGTASSKTTLYIGDSDFLTKPGTYTISSGLNNTGGVRFGVYLSGEYYNTNSSRTVTFNNAISSGRPYFQIDNGITVSNLILKPMIEEGSIATEYQPYQKQTYPINLGTLELCGINDNQDYIYEENNNWYISNKIHKKIINGTESGYSNPSTNRFNIDNILNTYYKSTDKITYYSNQYIGYGQKPDNASFNSLVNNVDYGFDFTNANTNTIRIKDTRFTTLEDFKTNLSNNNLIIYYVLATPIITQIVDQTLISQLNAIKNTKSYKNETNIYQTNDNLPFIINASVLKKND